MTQKSVQHLESTQAFIERLVELNRLHAPDSEFLDKILADGETGDGHDARKVMAAIYRGIPLGQPVREEATYLVRAFLIKRPFEEANFRTAMDYVQELLEHHNLTLQADVQEIEALGNEAWDLSITANGSLARDDLHGKDALFDKLFEWFEHRIQ